MVQLTTISSRLGLKCSDIKPQHYTDSSYSTPKGNDDGCPLIFPQDTVETHYHGAVEGYAISLFPVAPRAANPCDFQFAGIQLFHGHIQGRSGAVYLSLAGSSIQGINAATLTILPDTATGELRGISGSARYSAPATQSEGVEVVWDVEFEEFED